jgi:hypothetical protein
MNYLIAIFATYALTFLVTSSSLFNRSRNYLMVRTPWLAPIGGKHLLICRMCVGFWVAAAVAWWYGVSFLLVYGASYFLATQER